MSEQATIKYIQAPLTAETIKDLHAGDVVRISGYIYTARDAAHKRLYEALGRGEKLPLDLKDNVIYYVGPTPAKPGEVVGSAGPTTSDRAEVRCVLGLRATQHGVQHIRAVTDVTQRPQEKQEQGFVLVWPAAGESRWDTARRLRVAESSLRPAGKNALLAFRR